VYVYTEAPTPPVLVIFYTVNEKAPTPPELLFYLYAGPVTAAMDPN